MVGLCLVAVFAMAAVAATSASALPEWGQCYAKAGGKYTEGKCHTKSKVVKKVSNGLFEWRKGTEVKHRGFSGANVGSGGVLSSDLRIRDCNGSSENARKPKCKAGEEETISFSPVSVECESESNTGEITGNNGIKNVGVKFLGCSAFEHSYICSNGPVTGEITTEPLKGSLGYIKKGAPTEVGVLLTPAKAKGLFAKFSCGGVFSTAVGVGNAKEGAAYSPEATGGYDGIISPVTPINEMGSELTQVYAINNAEAAENIPMKFEGKHIDLLESYLFPPSNPSYGSTWSKAGETITNVNTSEEELEIKA